MEADELVAAGILVVIFVVDGLVVSRIDFWVSPLKMVSRDVPVDNWAEDKSSYATGLPEKGRPLRKRYRREQDEILRTKSDQRLEVVKRGLLTIGGLYLLNLGTLWALRSFGPICAGVNGIVKPFGGNLSIAAAGVLGSFVVLFTVSVIAFRYVTRK